MKPAILHSRSSICLPRPALAIRYETALCDSKGRVERILQRGQNTITDWGMDALATTAMGSLLANLYIYNNPNPVKYNPPAGSQITLAVTDPSNVTATSDNNFFTSAHVGSTLWIDGMGQELRIVSLVSATQVTCATRAGVWLSGSPPAAGPYPLFSVHATNAAGTAGTVTTINTFDTSQSNNNATLVEQAANRWNFQRIWLSSTLASTLTVNTLAWSSQATNMFGRATLATPDTIPAGKRYQVKLNAYFTITPLDWPAATLDFGPVVGTANVAFRAEFYPIPGGSNGHSPIFPWFGNSIATSWQVTPFTSAFALAAATWDGVPGSVANPHSGYSSTDPANAWSANAYTTGSFMRTVNLLIPDTVALTNVNGLTWMNNQWNLSPRSQVVSAAFSAPFNKPAGYQLGIPIQLYWTRQLAS